MSYPGVVPLRIYNTQTREKVDFQPIEPGKVRMYVCGITSYAPSHIGHARCFVAFDTIYRWLAHNYDVTFVRNYTDVDDKIIKAANAADEDPKVLAQRYIDLFAEEMGKLGCATPHVEPKVTEHIQHIIDLVKTLEEKGVAYAVDGDVYFDVMKFPAYGRLSGRTLADLEDLESGARVEVDTRKRSPHDFALWKSVKPGEPSWESPWGPGRPGWHIECSAMSKAYLGDTFDIHGGGKDLMFPHHENERAQSCAASDASHLANVWMHNGFVNLMPEGCPSCGAELSGAELPEKCEKCNYTFTEADMKMSKSRGNFYRIGEIIDEYEPESLRALLLGSHYRSPISFSHTLLEDAEKRLDKVYETLIAVDAFIEGKEVGAGDGLKAIFDLDPKARFAEAMDDDFNTAKAIADLSELFRIANDVVHDTADARAGRKLEEADKVRVLIDIRDALSTCGGVLGLWQEDPKAYCDRRKACAQASLGVSAEWVEGLIVERAEARKSKNWARADEIRDELKAKGVVLKDGADGTTWQVE